MIANALIIAFSFLCCLHDGVICQDFDSRLTDEAIALIRYRQDNLINSPSIPIRRALDGMYNLQKIQNYSIMFPGLYSNVNRTNSSVPFATTTTNYTSGIVTDTVIDIPITIYVPKSYANDQPIIVFLHGGDFVYDSRFSVDPAVTHLANLTNCIFVSVDYRLAPENRFPYGLEDSKRVVEYVIGNKLLLSELAGNAMVGVMGTGTGANFASVIANELTDVQLDFMISINGFFNILLPTLSNMQFNETFNYGYNYTGLNLTQKKEHFSTYYFNNESIDANSPQFYAPLGVTQNTPRSLLISSELDGLRDDTNDLMKSAYDSNNAVYVLQTVKGMIGGFLNEPHICPETFSKTVGVINRFLYNYRPYDKRLSDEAIAIIETNNQNAVGASSNFFIRRFQDQVIDTANIYRYGQMYPDLYSSENNSLNITNSTVPFNTTTKSIFTAGSPIIVFFHGGGFTMNTRWTFHAAISHLSNITCSIFVNVGYRLAPENKFPYGLEDSKRVVDYVSQNKLLFSPLAGNSKLGVMGTSSVYGFFNVLFQTPSNTEFNQDYNFGYNHLGLNLSSTASALASNYFPSSSSMNSTRFYTPKGVTSLSPKALLIACEMDPYRDDSLVLLKNAYDANDVTVETYTLKGMIHGFLGLPDKCQKTFFEFANVVNDYLSKL